MSPQLSFIEILGFITILIAIKLLNQFVDLLRCARSIPSPAFYPSKKLKKVVGKLKSPTAKTELRAGVQPDHLDPRPLYAITCSLRI
jgi:hypothetical protein